MVHCARSVSVRVAVRCASTPLPGFIRFLADELKPYAGNCVIELRVVCRSNHPKGNIMPRPRPHDATLATAFLSGQQRTRRYFVVRRQDVWFIRFDGEEFGPYETEREAMLFAIDAAHKLGAQGEATEVLLMD